MEICYKKFQVNPVDIVLFLSDINKVKIDEWKKLLKNFEKDLQVNGLIQGKI